MNRIFLVFLGVLMFAVAFLNFLFDIEFRKVFLVFPIALTLYLIAGANAFTVKEIRYGLSGITLLIIISAFI